MTFLLYLVKVRKALNGNNIEIPYKDLTYGKIIGTCTQEVLNLCNELKMAQQLKMNKTEGSHKKKRSRRRSKEERVARKKSRKCNRFTKDRSGRDLSKVKRYRCGHFGHIASNCKLNKLKTLELDGETYDKVYGLLYTSGLDDNYELDLGLNIEFLDLSDNDNNIDNPCTTCQGNDCNCEDDEIYKLQSQFQDFNMNTITLIISSSSKPFESKKNDSNDFEYAAPYSLKEVDDWFLKRNTFFVKDSSFDDLKIKVQNL
ncbi:hypothetical protein H5410_041308 [Solanum commersonii]|uniref:CCHC-type domain-containing protein n=1 Tax=Solanum commersonii TaxID=4109 RepID=A0A9J5XSP3_SOLCO|nr:hypothetical protein H5410_041308 [Solanum commersonii]